MSLYLDANVIIYGYEAPEPLRSVVRARLWQWCVEEGTRFVTSAFSRLECRVVPLRDQNAELLAEYDSFFGDQSVKVVNASTSIIDLATALRAKYGFKSPDAVHLATAMRVNGRLFLTGDARLCRCSEVRVEVIQQP